MKMMTSQAEQSRTFNHDCSCDHSCHDDDDDYDDHKDNQDSDDDNERHE